jgi:hypothetical protein
VPTQQLVLATYVYLFLLAAESITVYHIVCWHDKKQAAEASGHAWLQSTLFVAVLHAPQGR